jgi:hypothetical protein
VTRELAEEPRRTALLCTNAKEVNGTHEGMDAGSVGNRACRW